MYPIRTREAGLIVAFPVSSVPMMLASRHGTRTDQQLVASTVAVSLVPSIVTLQGMTRSRVTAVAVASAGMAVSTFVGAATAAVAPWLVVPVVIVWGTSSG
jgi:hypothetical protein